jgi:hypothetical protein
MEGELGIARRRDLRCALSESHRDWRVEGCSLTRVQTRSKSDSGRCRGFEALVFLLRVKSQGFVGMKYVGLAVQLKMGRVCQGYKNRQTETLGLEAASVKCVYK